MNIKNLIVELLYLFKIMIQEIHNLIEIRYACIL